MSTTSKKKVQPKESASKRRRDANVELGNLAELLPLPVTVASRLDKTSIVRLTISYWKLRELFPNGLGRDWGEEPFCDSIWENSGLAESGKFLNKALHGFVFVLGADGKILYISEEASAQLGYSQVQLTGQNFWSYVHTYDAEEAKENLCFDVDIPARKIGTYSVNEIEVPRSFSVRMKCILPKRQAELAIDGYKVIHCKGYLKLKRKESERNCPSDLTYSLAGVVAVGHSLSPTPNAELKLNSFDFMLRTELSLKIIYVEPGSQKITGYEPLQLKDKSFYRYVHPFDCKQIEEVHVLTIKKSQAISRYYRFLTSSGGWIWLQSSCTVVANSKADADHCILFINSVLSKPDYRKKGFIMDQLHNPKTIKDSTRKSRAAAKNAKKVPYHVQRASPTTNKNVQNIFPSKREPSSPYAQTTSSSLGITSSSLCYSPGFVQYDSQTNFFRPERTANLFGDTTNASSSLSQSHVILPIPNNDISEGTFTTSSYSCADPITKDFNYRTTHAIPMHQIQPSNATEFYPSQELFHASKFVAHSENSFHTQISQSNSVSPVIHDGTSSRNEQMLPFYRWNSCHEAKFQRLANLYAPVLVENDEIDEFRVSNFSPTFDGSSDSLKKNSYNRTESYGLITDSIDQYTQSHNLINERSPIKALKDKNFAISFHTSSFTLGTESGEFNQHCAQAKPSCNISSYSANFSPNNVDVSATCSDVQVALDNQLIVSNSSINNKQLNAPGSNIGVLLATNETAETSSDFNNNAFIANSPSCDPWAKPEFNRRTLYEGSSVNESNTFYSCNSTSINQNEKDQLIDLLFSSPFEKLCKQSDSITVNETSLLNPGNENIQDLHNLSISSTTHTKEQTMEHYDIPQKLIPVNLSSTDTKSQVMQQTNEKSNISFTHRKNNHSVSSSASYDVSNSTIFDLELIEPTITCSVTTSNSANLRFPPIVAVNSCDIQYLPTDRQILTEPSTSNIPEVTEDFLAPFRGLTKLKSPEQATNGRSTSSSSVSLGYISGSSHLSSLGFLSDCRESASFSNQSYEEVQTSRLCDSCPSF